MDKILFSDAWQQWPALVLLARLLCLSLFPLRVIEYDQKLFQLIGFLGAWL